MALKQSTALLPGLTGCFKTDHTETISNGCRRQQTRPEGKVDSLLPKAEQRHSLMGYVPGSDLDPFEHVL